MRPIKLTISAFGPYASKQVIDFEELKGRNIFVISGKTGAGKTTIFDAIAFNMDNKKYSIKQGDKVDVLHSLEINTFNGIQKVQLNVKINYVCPFYGTAIMLLLFISIEIVVFMS